MAKARVHAHRVGSEHRREWSHGLKAVEVMVSRAPRMVTSCFLVSRRGDQGDAITVSRLRRPPPSRAWNHSAPTSILRWDFRRCSCWWCRIQKSKRPITVMDDGPHATRIFHAPSARRMVSRRPVGRRFAFESGLYSSAAAPPTISVSSVVICAWRARLKVRRNVLLSFAALSVAAFIATMRATCSLTTESLND